MLSSGTRKLKNMSKEERSQRPATGIIRHATSHLIHQHHRAWTLKMKTRDYCAAQTPWLPVAGWSPGQLTGEAKERWSGRQPFGKVNDARIIANVCLTEAFANNRPVLFVCLFVCLLNGWAGSYHCTRSIKKWINKIQCLCSLYGTSMCLLGGCMKLLVCLLSIKVSFMRVKNFVCFFFFFK